MFVHNVYGWETLIYTTAVLYFVFGSATDSFWHRVSYVDIIYWMAATAKLNNRTTEKKKMKRNFSIVCSMKVPCRYQLIQTYTGAKKCVSQYFGSIIIETKRRKTHMMALGMGKIQLGKHKKLHIKLKRIFDFIHFKWISHSIYKIYMRFDKISLYTFICGRTKKLKHLPSL